MNSVLYKKHLEPREIQGLQANNTESLDLPLVIRTYYPEPKL
jgi:hypothetical protein